MGDKDAARDTYIQALHRYLREGLQSAPHGSLQYATGSYHGLEDANMNFTGSFEGDRILVRVHMTVEFPDD